MAELLFIGTGSGKVSLNRFHSSFLILTSRYNLLIDAGDGISKALLNQKIDFTSIDGIIFTHLHPDHYSGLAALIVQMKMCERKKQLDIYINSGLLDVIKNFILNSYLFPEKMGFEIRYIPFTENEKIRINEEVGFLPRQNSHLNVVSELEKYQSQSFSSSSLLLNIGNRKIHYTSDIGNKDDLLLFEDFYYDYLISEATHIKPEDIIDIPDKNVLPKKIILTHVSDEDAAELEKFLSVLQSYIQRRVILAFDGLRFAL